MLRASERAVATSMPRHVWTAVLLTGASASLLMSLVRADTIVRALILVALLALVPVFELLALQPDRTARRQSATFVLLVIAGGLGGWFAAVAVGLLGLVTEEWLTGGGLERARWQRPLLLVSLVGAGAIVQGVPMFAMSIMLLWVAAAGVWFIDRSRRGVAARLPAFAAIAWLALHLYTPLWVVTLPDPFAEFVQHAGLGLGFAVGFMTLDSVLVSGLGLRQSGLQGLQFWRTELMPTFARYNGMAFGGAVLTGVLFLPGRVDLVVAGIMLIGVILALTIRLQVTHGHRRLVATVCALSSALDARDPYTRSHSDRVAAYSVGIAEQLGWSGRQRRELELAAHLHDVGKIGIPDDILHKPGALTLDEFAIIQ